MEKYKYSKLLYTFFCLFLTGKQLMADPPEDHEQNCTIPSKPSHPVQEWQTQSAQSSTKNVRKSTRDYFKKSYPELENKASENLPKKIPVYQWNETIYYDNGSSWS